MGLRIPRGAGFEAGCVIPELRGVNVAVLYGGISAEREVSLISGERMCEALVKSGVDVTPVDVDLNFDAEYVRMLGVDMACIALHGEFGEDGQVQAILEEAGIPYTGSDAASSRLAMDKYAAKRAYYSAGLSIPADRMISTKAGFYPEALDGLHFPVVVKPSDSGSSLGVFICETMKDVAAAIDAQSPLVSSVLIEEFVHGREFTISVLGDHALEPIEIQTKRQFYDFNAKYNDNDTRYLLPAPITPFQKRLLQRSAEVAHTSLGCRDVSRTDIILSFDGTPFVLETNTIPGMTTHSLLPMAASVAGLEFHELVAALAIRAWERGVQELPLREAV
ncbi:MAG: D-alanine--D-alanine ligase [Planctomycetota bacterium]